MSEYCKEFDFLMSYIFSFSSKPLLSTESTIPRNRVFFSRLLITSLPDRNVCANNLRQWAMNMTPSVLVPLRKLPNSNVCGCRMCDIACWCDHILRPSWIVLASVGEKG
jgi:hypothetical protein